MAPLLYLAINFGTLESKIFASQSSNLGQRIAFEIYDAELRQSILDFQKEVFTGLGLPPISDALLSTELFKIIRKISTNIENEFGSEEELKTLQNLAKQPEIKKINRITIQSITRSLFQVPLAEAIGFDVSTSWLEINGYLAPNEFEAYLLDLVWNDQICTVSKKPSNFKKYVESRFVEYFRQEMDEREIESAKLLIARNSSLFERLAPCTVTAGK